MSNKSIVLAGLGVVALGVLYGVFSLPSVDDVALPTGPEAVARGEYVFNAGGCGACHQPEGSTALTGGYEIPSPFGTFRSPNITPDPETGIGGWTGKDFILAIKHGRKSNGGFYYPAFPFRSYKDMTDQDALDIGAYLMSIAPVKAEEKDHELPPYLFSWMLGGWNILADMMEGKEPAVTGDEQVQRGAYLARALGHCGECHSPRNSIGMMLRAQEFTGQPDFAPKITGEELGGWSNDDFVAFLQLGLTPEGEFVGGEMADVIEHTKALNEEDQAAYAAFFLRGDGAAPAAQ
jgi:mono/diheme cytochrome c family protein